MVDTATMAELKERYDSCDRLLACSPLLVMSMSNKPHKPLVLTVTKPPARAKKAKSETGKCSAAASLPRTAATHPFTPRQGTIRYDTICFRALKS